MANTERRRRSLLGRILAGGLWIAAISRTLTRPARHRIADPEELRRPNVAFEQSDINARGVILAAVGILLTTWIIVALLYGVFAHFVRTPGEGGPLAPRAESARVPLPPDPRLQAAPRRDFQQVRDAAEASLHSYGWADRARGVATIPIDRAIELTAQRGIPPQHPPPGMFYPPRAGNRLTGFEPTVEAQPR